MTKLVLCAYIRVILTTDRPVLDKFWMAISPQQIIRSTSTSYSVLAYGYSRICESNRASSGCTKYNTNIGQHNARGVIIGHNLKYFLLIRPPVYGSNGRSYKMLVMFFFLSFFSPRVLRVPSTDRRETLPPDRNLRVFYKASPKIRGALPQKNLGPKTCKISVNFLHFRIWSRISPERLKISKICRRYKLWQFLLRLTKKVRWTLVH